VGAGDVFAASSGIGGPDSINHGLIEATGASSSVLLGSYNVTNYNELEATGGTSSADAILQVEAGNLFLNLGTVVASGSDALVELTGNITNGNKTQGGSIKGSTTGNAVVDIPNAVVDNAYGVIDGGVGGVSLDPTPETTTVVNGGTLAGNIDAGANGGIPILNGVTISAGATVNVDGGGGVALQGTIVNDGLIIANSQTDSGANIYIDGTVTLEGTSTGADTATVELSPNAPGGFGVNNLFGGVSAPSELKNVSNTIMGQGEIASNGSDAFVLDNETSGIIEANANTAVTTGPGDENANLEVDSKSTVLNAGTIESSANATLAVWDPLQNSGTVLAQGQEINLLGAVTGTGSDEISGTTLDFNSSVGAGQSVSFVSTGTLWLGDAVAFKGSVQNFGGLDEIVLAGFDDSTLHPLRYAENGAGTGGTLTIDDGANVAHIKFVGDYKRSDFAPMPGSGSTIIEFK
jgi:hypothetical protein